MQGECLICESDETKMFFGFFFFFFSCQKRITEMLCAQQRGRTSLIVG